MLRFEPYADYYQFMLHDREATDGGIDDGWDEATESWRIAVGDQTVAVATARYDHVPVVLEILAGAPPEAEGWDGYDHVVEADIDVASGMLAVTGCTEMPWEVEGIPVPAALYRLRVMYLPTDHRPPDSDGEAAGAYLEYRLAMWPTTRRSGVSVLKQGPPRWAG